MYKKDEVSTMIRICRVQMMKCMKFMLYSETHLKYFLTQPAWISDIDLKKCHLVITGSIQCVTIGAHSTEQITWIRNSICLLGRLLDDSVRIVFDILCLKYFMIVIWLR